MEIGIVGLPNVGKSSLFNALTAAGVASSNFPFTTIEPNVGVVPIKDERLYQLQKIFSAPKLISAAIRFLDIAGLMPGASKGEGRGNKFLSDIRTVDAIAQVVRCFEDKDIVNVIGDVNPKKDAEIISTELMLADLEQVEKLKDKYAGLSRSGNEEAKKYYEVLQKIQEGLHKSIPVRKLDIDHSIVQEFNFLTSKPILYVANTSEDSKKENIQMVYDFAKEQGAGVVELNAKLEAEIMMLSEEERASYREALGMQLSGLERLAAAGQKLLKLIIFFAAGPKEVHAWHVQEGSPVVKAAGKIHSDLEKGFIRAEVYNAKEIIEVGSETELRTKGKIRMEGKDYITQDGDVLHIHFKV
ncbi:MAG: redox-regulated ATPase YchF [Elusimicrobiota bacterium]